MFDESSSEHTLANAYEHTDTHTSSTVCEQEHIDDVEGKHTASDLAAKYGVSSATLRTRWFPWLCKAVGEGRLKVTGRYTDLADYLFADYATVDTSNKEAQDAWVVRVAGENPPAESMAEDEVEFSQDGVFETPSSFSALALFEGNRLGSTSDADEYEVLALRESQLGRNAISQFAAKFSQFQEEGLDESQQAKALRLQQAYNEAADEEMEIIAVQEQARRDVRAAKKGQKKKRSKT